MEFNSMIWLETSKRKTIDKSVIENLNLEKVYQKLLQNEHILYSLCMDEDTIQYRGSVIEDFMKNPKLISELMNCLTLFSELKPLYHTSQYKRATLYRIIDLLIVMEKAVMTLEELNQVLNAYTLKSEGFLELRKQIERNIVSKDYKQMKTDLREIKYIFRQIKSATLSVSMTSGLRPAFAQVSSVNDHKIKYPNAFRKVSDVLRDDPVFMDKRLTSYVPVFRIGKINYNLLEEIEFGLKEHKSKLQAFVDTYERVDITPFLTLYDEMLFYEASIHLFEALESMNLPVSRPKISLIGGFKLKIQDGYNLNLALSMMENKTNEVLESEMIYNSIEFNDDKKFFVISGANRGGKTTFTQAIGQIQLMAQLGLFVPAKEVEFSLADTIITHFPVSEKDTQDYGRFGKECERFVEGFQKATDTSLFLLNEPFSGTSHLESLNIATQGICALIEKNVPFIINTHLHELYSEVKESSIGQAKHTVISLATHMEGEISTYSIEEKEPLGKSYAMEIATKYGVTLDQLTALNSKKKEAMYETGN